MPARASARVRLFPAPSWPTPRPVQPGFGCNGAMASFGPGLPEPGTLIPVL